MSSQKIKQIVENLYEETKDNRIDWIKTETEGTFQVSFVDYSLRIWSRPKPSKFAEDDYFLGIYDQSGALMVETRSLEFSKETMKDLYELARRKAMGVEEALDRILDSIGGQGKSSVEIGSKEYYKSLGFK